MKILTFEPAASRGGGTETLAVFDLELTDEVRIYGLRLVEHRGRRLTYAPNGNGGRRLATFAPALAERITAIAIHQLEGHTTANEDTQAAA
jgi:hypothetical protein